MHLHRFYIEQSITGDQLTVTEERLLHQWRKVLRAGPGYELVLFEGSGFAYPARIEEIAPDHATLTVGHAHAVAPREPSVWLAVGLIKRDKFEWIIEKATELGVAGIIPLVADRSQKQDLKLDRARKIMIEAAEQSGRADLPTLWAPSKLREVLEGSDPASLTHSIVLDHDGEPLAPMNQFEGSDPSSKAGVTLYIGPEGGWSDREREQFESAGVSVRSLGPRNLKTETAAIVGAAGAFEGCEF